MSLEKMTIRESMITCSFEKPCITLPAPAPGKTSEFKLRSCLLERLPTFHGLSTEDPLKHLKEFELVCTSLAPVGADENILMLKAFYFSLADEAREWLLYHLPFDGQITSWVAMKKVFLVKYSATFRVMQLRKRISGILRGEDESLPDYYERFKSLIAQCPQHHMEGELLVQHFYEGLILHEEKIASCLKHRQPQNDPYHEGWNNHPR